MAVMRISKGGQISIPAEIRRRWGTETVSLDDEGDRLVVRPVPPMQAALGSLQLPPGLTSEVLRAMGREQNTTLDQRHRANP